MRLSKKFPFVIGHARPDFSIFYNNMIVIKPLGEFVPSTTIGYTLETDLSALPSGFDGNLCNKVEFVYDDKTDTNNTCLEISPKYDHETSLVINQETILGNQASVDINLTKFIGTSKKPSQYNGLLSYSDVGWGDTSVTFNKMSRVNVSDNDLVFTTSKMKNGDQASCNLKLTPLSPGTKQLILTSSSDRCQVEQVIVKDFLVKLPAVEAELVQLFPLSENDDLIVDQGDEFEQVYLFNNRSLFDLENIEVVIDFNYEKAKLSIFGGDDPNYKNPSSGTVSLTGPDPNVINRIIWKIPFVKALRNQSIRISSGANNDLGVYQLSARATGEFIFDCEPPALNVSVQPLV